MNRLSLTAVSFFLLTSNITHANDATSSGAGARSIEQGTNSQTIIRGGANPSSKDPAEYFTGNVPESSLYFIGGRT